MLAFISFVLVIIGSINWFCIGILQYDFVAGLFGSQSNVFSRLVYTLVGIASIIVTFNLIKNKGKFVVSFKKANKEYKEYMDEKKQENKEKVLAKAEASDDFAKDEKESDTHCKCSNGHCDCETDTCDDKHDCDRER